MQMRHLYRSPLSICLSSSLIRAFRASMVVAVDSSSVTLGERNSEEGGSLEDILTDTELCVRTMLNDVQVSFRKLRTNFLHCYPQTVYLNMTVVTPFFQFIHPPLHPSISCLDQTSFPSINMFIYRSQFALFSFILHSIPHPPDVPDPKQPLINAQPDNRKCAFNTVRQHMKQQ